jgi:hypothetical protein
MKEYPVHIEERDLSCSICLNLFHIPITVTCGHTFCFACINSYGQKKNSDSIQCPLCRQKILSSQLYECSENKFIRNIIKICKLKRTLNKKEQQKVEKYKIEKKKYFQQKLLLESKNKSSSTSFCCNIYSKIEGYIACIAFLILMLVILELLAQAYLITTRIPNLVDYNVDDNNVIVSSSIRSDHSNVKQNINYQEEVIPVATTGKRKAILDNANSGSPIDDPLVSFFVDAAGNVARETFLPPNYMIVMLSYLDRLILNNTFTGLGLEAVMVDPIPNIINATTKILFGV